MTESVVVLVTVGSADEGERIAHSLVSERLAACVSLVGPVTSIYRWQGEIVRDEERLLIIKTRGTLVPELEARVKALHSYTTPEVVALPISAGSQAYLRWLEAETVAKA